ncbi:MAG: aminotransferase class V-fold PLP-dependent enzyme [Anaerolineae bacterium]|nr:aminotransferase class V-fold PLP-dependent enzyme [Anaerolineae bacterium]
MTLSHKTLNHEEIRQAYPILREVVYLNAGTYGLMPEPALAEFVEALKEFERSGVASKIDFGVKITEARQYIAAILGAEPEEIAFTRNTTDGINLVLAGLDWQPGDEIITTNEEHEAVIHPLLYLQRHQGIKIRLVEVSPRAEIMLDRLEKVLTDRTRLLIISYVTCETGTRLPACAICRWAASRQLLTLLDGAQASGVFPINLREIGCDFYTSNGHKWLSGPKGTGIFYGQRAKLLNLRMAYVGAGSLERADLATSIAEPWPNALRFEFGTRTWPLYIGLNASLNWLGGWGWANIYHHIATLSAYLKERILERPFLKLLTPRAWEDSSGLTCFSVEGRAAGEVSKFLRERRRIHVRVIPHYNAIRISTAHFNNEVDVDNLMAALDEFIRETT